MRRHGGWRWIRYIVVTDLDELRWAGNRLLGDPPCEDDAELTLTVYSSGHPASVVELESHRTPGASEPLNWAAVAPQPLAGELLPVGHPAQIRGWVSQYGFGLHHDV